ncbi:zinc-binding dehydrogenase (plasmid) [Rhodococcus pyridinivorans]|uniref:zinc-binding dehydrogenase n=1 Tax=Rhodococcus pyridinivorans TaxID=103816 RepID=UPI001FFE61D7|nr:zinc-binding dehydrogenase [Rhodococcus pyridinivorans]UPK66399.1 zinc-binding dehydrogenase [Rhodococcus pyridinivorans]
MKAWRLTAAHQPLELVEVPHPQAGPDQVVIDVKAAGICHTDVGYLDGTLTGILGYTPITLGHEIAGVVAAVGSDVSSFTVGQRVAVPATIAGPGTGVDGGFADQVLAFEHQVVAVPDGVSWEQAAPATDAGMTSFHALKVGGVTEGTKLGIIGAGGLGSLAIQFAKALGAKVFVAETNRAAWDRIRGFGLDGLAENIRDFVDEELDVIVDYAGFDTTTPDAVETVAFRGTVVQVGMGTEHTTLSTTTMIVKQLSYLGSNGGTNEDCSEVLDLIAAGTVSSHVETVGFDDIAESIARFERGEANGRLVAVRD